MNEWGNLKDLWLDVQDVKRELSKMMLNFLAWAINYVNKGSVHWDRKHRRRSGFWWQHKLRFVRMSGWSDWNIWVWISKTAENILPWCGSVNFGNLCVQHPEDEHNAPSNVVPKVAVDVHLHNKQLNDHCLAALLARSEN